MAAVTNADCHVECQLPAAHTEIRIPVCLFPGGLSLMVRNILSLVLLVAFVASILGCGTPPNTPKPNTPKKSPNTTSP
jgi:hypothetical protein